MTSGNFLIIDFDSTFVKLETLDELAKEVLTKNPRRKEIQKEIEEITKRGMRGEISFLKSLRSRLKLFSASQVDIEKIAQKMKENISDSFLANKEFFKENKQQIFIVSGGFKEYILPATNELGISEENVFANEFVLDKQGKIIGINENNFLAKTQGKVKQVEALNLKGMVFAVGDGWTDYEIKREDEADYFLVYTENISRKNVIDLADKVVKNFGEVIKFIKIVSKD